MTFSDMRSNTCVSTRYLSTLSIIEARVSLSHSLLEKISCLATSNLTLITVASSSSIRGSTRRETKSRKEFAPEFYIKCFGLPLSLCLFLSLSLRLLRFHCFWLLYSLYDIEFNLISFMSR